VLGDDCFSTGGTAAGYTNAFDAHPPALDWATSSRAGAAGDNYDSDTDVNANITAAGVTAQTMLDAGNPPPKTANAAWSSSGFYLQTRPTGNRYSVLMGNFVNNTGTNATAVTLSYLFTITGAGVAEDNGKGARVYHSLTGSAGGWANLPTLNTTASVDGSSVLSTNLALKWTNGASLYVLWVDANANANANGDDSANQVDNFSLQVTAGAAPVTDLTCTITSPTNNAVFVSGTPITTTATILNGTAPLTVEYFVSNGAGATNFVPVGSVTTPPYNVSLGDLPAGVYSLYAVGSDSAVTPAVTNSATPSSSRPRTAPCPSRSKPGPPTL